MSPGHPTKHAPFNRADPGKTVALRGIPARWRSSCTASPSQVVFTPGYQITTRWRQRAAETRCLSPELSGKHQCQTLSGSLEKGSCPLPSIPRVETPPKGVGPLIYPHSLHRDMKSQSGGCLGRTGRQQALSSQPTAAR